MQRDEDSAERARAARVGDEPAQEGQQYVEQQHAWGAQESEIITRATRHVLGRRAGLTGDRALQLPRQAGVISSRLRVPSAQIAFTAKSERLVHASV